MTFLLCGPGWYVHKLDVQNKWNDNTHTRRDEDGRGLGTESPGVSSKLTVKWQSIPKLLEEKPKRMTSDKKKRVNSVFTALYKI